MIARVRKSMEEKDQGFTLIELLVVMIIIGILAAIAIPVFLSQRKKAEDSAAKADVSTIGKEVATYFVDWDGSTAVTVNLDTAAGKWEVNGEPVGNASTNVELGSTANLGDDAAWCVSVFNDKGDKSASPEGYKYSAAGGLEEGQC
ncbi:prepilin-type N-terminal cleavage/methylation domain-containing protein [Cellulomonas sp.]|uniref:type II secretion system protein n=1 Tax=Cellulomonas sp. TaxID=40001 RepID=UPI00258F837C|nr:prepilin-type N-terminal cleavage/methylation domain-containing protein [Cellulomonas sp.]MCR6689916.1 prepilin-type N-terminal cleavage/methylation domain-containing protein [Cellulomonas sp.]